MSTKTTHFKAIEISIQRTNVTFQSHQSKNSTSWLSSIPGEKSHLRTLSTCHHGAGEPEAVAGRGGRRGRGDQRMAGGPALGRS